MGTASDSISVTNPTPQPATQEIRVCTVNFRFININTI